jgi:DNA-binding response OmpR family regulator
MNRKILVVDDEPNIVKSLTDLLQANGYDVVTAVDGKEGIDKCKKEQPDLVLLDIMMPRISGLELLKAVKDNVKSAHIPIIVISAKSDIETVKEAMRSYADKYITKPYSPQEVLKSIQNSLQYTL